MSFWVNGGNELYCGDLVVFGSENNKSANLLIVWLCLKIYFFINGVGLLRLKFNIFIRLSFNYRYYSTTLFSKCKGKNAFNLKKVINLLIKLQMILRNRRTQLHLDL